MTIDLILWLLFMVLFLLLQTSGVDDRVGDGYRTVFT